MSYFPSITAITTSASILSIQQNVVASTLNSSTATINAGETLSGTVESTLGIAGIQVNYVADQNATIYVDQSMDGTNWDIVDPYTYYYSKGGFSFTTQATGSYFRLRVKNVGTVNMTYSRLQTALCPIVEAVPRSLDDQGHFQTAIHRIIGPIGVDVKIDPMGGLRATSTTRLVGTTFTGTTLDPNFWTSTTGGGATVTIGGGFAALSAGTSAAASSALLQSVRYARYVAGNANYYRAQIRCPILLSTSGNTRRWGAYDNGDGFFFQLTGNAANTTLAVVTRSNSADTITWSGNFNGDLGATVSADTNINTYEIWWTNKSTWFFYNDLLIHKSSGTTAPLAQTLTLPVRAECNNDANNTSNNALAIRVASISRQGQLLTQPNSRYVQGAAAATICKYGSGNLHSIVWGGTLATGYGLTAWDGIATGAGNATVLWRGAVTIGAQGSSTPLSIDFKGLPFFNGLTIQTAVNTEATIVYE